MFLFSCSAHAAWGRRTCMLSSVFVVLGKLRGTKGVCSLQSFLLSRRGCVHRLRDSVLVLAKASILPEFPPLRFWGANPHAGIFFFITHERFKVAWNIQESAMQAKYLAIHVCVRCQINHFDSWRGEGEDLSDAKETNNFIKSQDTVPHCQQLLTLIRSIKWALNLNHWKSTMHNSANIPAANPHFPIVNLTGNIFFLYL